MFGPNGIYIAGEGIDRAASFELLNPVGDKVNPNAQAGAQQTGLVHIFGGSSTRRWETDKLSLRFNFHTDFATRVLGDSAAGAYDTLVLDAQQNNTFVHPELVQRNRGDYVRDVVTSDFQNATASYAPHSRRIHVYINGLYWGLYTLHERPDDHFAAAYLGGNEDDYDAVKHNPTDPGFLVAGKIINPAQPVSNTNHTAGVNYQALLNLAAADLSVTANYNALAAKLDVPDFIRYMLVNFYGGNTDWAHHNWYATFNRVQPDGKWRFHSWDAEHTFKFASDDATTKNDAGSPTAIHQKLTANAEYRVLFGDTAQQLLFNGGLFTPAPAKALFNTRFTEINEAIRGESGRWGDTGGWGTDGTELHLRFSNVAGGYLSWWSERQRMLTTVLDGSSNRTTALISQLRARNLLPNLGAPIFGQQGGVVPANYALTMTNPGGAETIYFTQAGSDPRVAGTGAISPTATAYSGAVTLASSQTIKARVFNGGAWSALNEAYFSVGTVAAAAGNLVISKIHYRPSSPTAAEIAAGFGERSDFEFLEVLNISANRVSLDGISFSLGLDIAPLPDGVRELTAGERALYVAKQAPFEFRYGSALPIAGEFVVGSNLDNDGETLHLLSSTGATIVIFAYDDIAPWPLAPDGTGPSLVLMNSATSDPSDGSNWRASTGVNGSPAVDDRRLFPAWQTANFPAGGPDSLPAADADDDGLNNLFEHFLGSNPNAPTPAELIPAVSVQAIDPGTGVTDDYAVFTFRRLKAAEDVTFTLETTTDFLTWQTGGLLLAAPPIDNGDGTETRRYRAAQPVGNESTRHFRLKLGLR